ncbi:MAG TPA: thiamine phosphate synthase [Candidatus Acidoferrales bacterium]|jgi:thiamine-phosphate pyrophosphorylase|nr:thiamine phosphate synthase [Candidatus Acidoferrales bacterium]
MRLVLPKLYVILDAGMLTEPAGETAQKLMDAGVKLLQYRAKNAAARELWNESRAIAEATRRANCIFVVNDRPDVAYLAGADGVHVGQDDLGVEQARRVIGSDRWVGVSTHSLEQFEKAAASSADYIAVGPIFQTSSKANPDPVVGTALLRRVRTLTEKPIVAIGGITLERAAEVLAAGADSVAVISDVLKAKDPAAKAREFILRLDAVKPAASH